MKKTLKLIALVAMLLGLGCSAVKPACAVIDVVHHACEYITVEYVDTDGAVRRQQVPVAMVRDAAMRARRDGVGQ